MTPVTLTRDIDTLRGLLPAGLCLFVVSWGENGDANLGDHRQRLVVSLAAADSFRPLDPSPMTEGLDPAEEFTSTNGEEHAVENKQVRQSLESNGTILGSGSRSVEVHDEAGAATCPPVDEIAETSHQGGVYSSVVFANGRGRQEVSHRPQSSTDGVAHENSRRSRTAAVVTRSLMPCDHCGYFQGCGAQCRCGAVLSSALAGPDLPGPAQLEECPFEPNVSGSRLQTPDSRLTDPNAELSALAQRDPAPLVNREESIRLARLVPRLVEVSPTLSARVRERLAEFGYVLVDRDDRNYVPSKSQEEFTTQHSHAKTRRREEEYLRGDDCGISAGGDSSPLSLGSDRLLGPVQLASENHTTHDDRGQESLTTCHATECEPACSPSVPPCLRGESFDWRHPLPAYEPNQIGWKLMGPHIVRVFQHNPEEC